VGEGMDEEKEEEERCIRAEWK